MLDSITNFAEGLFLLAMGVHLFERSKSVCDWTFSVLFVTQGVLSVLWAIWHNYSGVKLMNDWLPQYVPIVAYLWLAFYARAHKRVGSGSASD